MSYNGYIRRKWIWRTKFKSQTKQFGIQVEVNIHLNMYGAKAFGHFKLLLISTKKKTYQWMLRFINSLRLSSHNSSRKRGFYWQTIFFSSVYNCSMLYKLRLWANQSFHGVTPFSAKLYYIAYDQKYGDPPCWKIFTFMKVLYQIVRQ